MFTEELRTNDKAKKRQEAARAARKRLQQAKQTRQNLTATTTTAAAAAAAATTAIQTNYNGTSSDMADSNNSNKSSIQTSNVTTTPVTFSVVSDSPIQIHTNVGVNSAVEAALEQRLIRQNQQLVVRSAIKIQSTYRGLFSRKQTRDEQIRIFDQRISDINTLMSILRTQKVSSVYAPPPATVSLLVSQFLFLYPLQTIDQPILYCTDTWKRFGDLLRLVINPGLSSIDADENSNALLPWIQYYGGRRRLSLLLKHSFKFYAYHVIPPRKTSVTNISVFDSMSSIVLPCVELFVRNLIIGNAHHAESCNGNLLNLKEENKRDSLVHFCRYMCGIDEVNLGKYDLEVS